MAWSTGLKCRAISATYRLEDQEQAFSAGLIDTQRHTYQLNSQEQALLAELKHIDSWNPLTSWRVGQALLESSK
jgi:hypothetical protein